MIINTLFGWFRTEIITLYPTYQVFKGQVPSTIKTPREFISINETSGTSDVYPSRFVKDIQIVVQAQDNERCRELAYNVFTLISERYDFEIIPDILTRSTDLKINVAQIKAKSDPIELGEVEKGIYQFSLNYEITGNILT